MLDKSTPPKRRHAGSNIQRLCNLFVLQPFGSKQNDAAAKHHPRLCGATTRLLLQLPPDLFTQNNGLRYTHIQVSSS